MCVCMYICICICSGLSDIQSDVCMYIWRHLYVCLYVKIQRKKSPHPRNANHSQSMHFPSPCPRTILHLRPDRVRAACPGTVVGILASAFTRDAERGTFLPRPDASSLTLIFLRRPIPLHPSINPPIHPSVSLPSAPLNAAQRSAAHTSAQTLPYHDEGKCLPACLHSAPRNHRSLGTGCAIDVDGVRSVCIWYMVHGIGKRQRFGPFEDSAISHSTITSSNWWPRVNFAICQDPSHSCCSA